LKYKWLNKNVDLNTLADAVSHFLENNKFKTLTEKYNDKIRILGSRRKPNRQFISVKVIISGTPNDFTVELKAGEQMRSFLKLSSLVSFFGGGLILLKYHKTVEFYQQLEEKFWKYLEERVAELVDSAESPS